MPTRSKSHSLISLESPTRRKVLFVSVGAAFAGGLSAMRVGAIPAGRDLRTPDGPIPREYFGMHIHRADTSTPWPGVHFGSWRLWDAAVSWSRLEPKRGQWDFARLDRYVAMARLTGVNLLLPLGLPAAWASARPEEASAYQPGNAAEPRDMTDWRNYVRTVATRYAGRIRYYELWNEPNLRNFYTGSVETMVRLAQETYAILKQVDENNLLAAPATTEGGKKLDWLDRYLALGGRRFLDVLSHHFYVPRESPEAMLALMDEIRLLMAKHGVANKPIWNTETGWWFDKPSNASTYTSWKRLNKAEAGAYVSRALILGWAAGMERFYWYSWEHGNMGLVEGEDYALNVAGKAYDKTQAWLEGAVMTGCALDRGRWVCRLKRRGEEAWLVWLDADEKHDEWTIPETWPVTHFVTLEDEPRALSSRKVMLGPGPILFTRTATWTGRFGAAAPDSV